MSNLSLMTTNPYCVGQEEPVTNHASTYRTVSNGREILLSRSRLYSSVLPGHQKVEHRSRTTSRSCPPISSVFTSLTNTLPSKSRSVVVTFQDKHLLPHFSATSMDTRAVFSAFLFLFSVSVLLLLPLLRRAGGKGKQIQFVSCAARWASSSSFGKNREPTKMPKSPST